MKIKFTEGYKKWATQILLESETKIDFSLEGVHEAKYLDELDYKTGERGVRVEGCDIDGCPLEVIESSFTIIVD